MSECARTRIRSLALLQSLAQGEVRACARARPPGVAAPVRE